MPTVITRGAISAKGFGFGAPLAGGGGGDGTKAIFQLGNASNIRNKYTYACCSSTSSGVGQVNQTGYSGFGASCRVYTNYATGFSNYSKGIFTLGSANVKTCPNCCFYSITTQTNKYTYSNCTSVVGPCIPQSTSKSSSTSNKTIGIMAAGCIVSCLCPCVSRSSTVKYKFTYSNCTFSSASAVANSVRSTLGSAAGNNSIAIMALGAGCYCVTGQIYPTKFSTRNKYTYSSNITVVCGVGAASIASARGAAAGNSTVGIFALGATGANCAVASNTRNKYTYSSCTSTASGVAVSSAAGACGSAAGNSTRGIFALGGASPTGNSTTRNKYTYASCTSTACGVAVSSSGSKGGAGISWAVCVNS